MIYDHAVTLSSLHRDKYLRKWIVLSKNRFFISGKLPNELKITVDEYFKQNGCFELLILNKLHWY